jgi:hypothetical protein
LRRRSFPRWAADGLVIRTRGWRRARFWITDPGALGALLAAPITSQPQIATLDLDAVVERRSW